MFEIKIKGFKTKEAAQEFMNWYEGQGEQDLYMWMEYQEKGNTILEEQTFNTKRIDNENLILELN